MRFFKKIKTIIQRRLSAVDKYISPKAKTCNDSHFEFPVYISEDCFLTKVNMSRYSYVARGTRITDCNIGSFTSIGPEALIGGLGHHPLEHFSTSPLTYSPVNGISKLLGHLNYDLKFKETGHVNIGADVWIGARVIIMDGVSIGIGAVIGANTVVTKDIPPYAVYYGSPPTIKKFRFSNAVISKLLETKWWTLSVERISTEHMLSLINIDQHKTDENTP